jgi:hypothetical protein
MESETAAEHSLIACGEKAGVTLNQEAVCKFARQPDSGL